MTQKKWVGWSVGILFLFYFLFLGVGPRCNFYGIFHQLSTIDKNINCVCKQTIEGLNKDIEQCI